MVSAYRSRWRPRQGFFASVMIHPQTGGLCTSQVIGWTLRILKISLPPCTCLYLYHLGQRFSKCDPWMRPSFSEGKFPTGKEVTNASSWVPSQIFSNLFKQGFQVILVLAQVWEPPPWALSFSPWLWSFGALVAFNVNFTLLPREWAQETKDYLTNQEVRIGARTV